MLTFAAVVAGLVGTVASLFPETLLSGKGVEPDAAVIVWVREVGVAILATGVIAFLVRQHAPSPTMRAFLFGNALHQLLLSPIEVVAYLQGTITKLSGIVPNTVLHLALASAFLACASREPRQLASQSSS